MPLSEMLKYMVESNDPANWEATRQKRLMGEMELQEKQRAMQDAQRLRELYSSGGQPDINQVMAISPQLGIEMQKAGNTMYMQQLQAQELQQKIQAQNLDSAAGAGFPSLVQYDADIASGMPHQQALQKFHTANGKVVSDAAKAGASWLQPGASYDPNQATPDNVRSANARFGRFTPHDKLQQETQTQAMRSGFEAQTKRMPSYGDIKPIWDPERGQFISTPQTQMPDFSGASSNELNMLEKSLPGMQEGAEKEALKKFLAEKKGISPEIKPMSEVKAEQASAVKSAQIEAEEAAADKKALDTYFRGRPPEEVRDLIKQSIEGDLETGLARIGKTIGVAVPGGSPTAALRVITQQLAATTPFAPGSQSDVEYKARLQKIGDPASDEPIQNRLAALDEFYRDQEAFVAQKYKPESVEDILDKRQQGYISEDTARKLYKKLKSKSGKL